MIRFIRSCYFYSSLCFIEQAGLRDDGFNNPDNVLIFFVILSAPAFQLEMKIIKKVKKGFPNRFLTGDEFP